MALNSMLSCLLKETYQIRKNVSTYYLLRSKQDYPSKIQCPFDPLHVIDEEYFEQHILNCASSGNVKKELYNFHSAHELGSVPLDTVKELSVPLMKDWHEENVKMYDPWRSTETRNIIRCLIGGTKSEKKLFKLSERRRIENLEICGIIDSNLKTNLKHKQSTKRVNILRLIKDLKRLTLEDYDTLLKSIDISKLFISDDNTVAETKQMSEIIEEVLIQKFKKLVLCCLK